MLLSLTGSRAQIQGCTRQWCRKVPWTQAHWSISGVSH